MKVTEYIHAHRLNRKRKKQEKRYMAWRARVLGITTEDYQKLVRSVKRGMR
jgi:hypothetical protein